MRNTRVKASGEKTLFEGWQAGLLAVSIAGLGLLLGTPRAVEPTEVPLPLPSPKALEASSKLDAERAARMTAMNEAERGGPLFNLRLLGEKLRAYNEADAAHDTTRLVQAREALLPAVQLVFSKEGVEPILQLRAFQQQSFLRELAAYERTGVVSDELKQVGGGFLSLVEGASWKKPPHTIVIDPVARVALFKRRFAEVLSLGREPQMALTMDEARALYAFFLTHPVTEGASAAEQHRSAWAFRIRKINELGLLDASYPLHLARGVALYQLGDARSAVAELREHIAGNQDGPFTLRARNYLVAAVEQASAE